MAFFSALVPFLPWFSGSLEEDSQYFQHGTLVPSFDANVSVLSSLETHLGQRSSKWLGKRLRCKIEHQRPGRKHQGEFLWEIKAFRVTFIHKPSQTFNNDPSALKIFFIFLYFLYFLIISASLLIIPSMYFIYHLIMVLSHQHFNVLKYFPALINVPTHIQVSLPFNLSRILQVQASSMDYPELSPFPHSLTSL